MLGSTKKFSTSFGYSIAILLLIAGVFSVWGFINFLQNQAQQNSIKEIILSPSTCTGWQNAGLAEEVSLPANARVESFSFQNSADSVSSAAAAPDDALQNLPEAAKESVVCSDFSIDDAALREKDLRSVDISFSVAAQADANTQDIVSFEYTVDGDTWRHLESVAIMPNMSNFNNDGYRTYNLNGQLLPEEISHLQVRVTHHKLLQGASHLFLDGVAVKVGLQKKVAIPPIPDSIVKVAKLDFSLNEEPNFSITTEDKNIWSVFGKEPERQTVKGATIHHVTDEVATADFRVENGKQGLDTVQRYVFSKENFTKPGLYVADFEIEKDGVTQKVEREFLWGVVAMNVRRSIQDVNSWAEIGLAVLDENGTTICDADLSVVVTYPSGYQEQVSKNDGTITTNETCVDKNVTNEPDYFFQIETAEEGVYVVEATTMTSRGEFTLHDSFQVRSDAQFDVERTKFPTRIYPVANYPVEFTITPKQDYAGDVIERVPASFSLPEITADGKSSVDASNPNYTDITWTVDWKAGQVYTLGYTIDPPDVSPEFFLLGPLTISDFIEARQWQIASDSVLASTAATATSATLGSNHQGNGRSLVFYDDLHAYIIYLSSTLQLKYLETGNAGQDWGAGTIDPLLIDAGTANEIYAVWYDQWTPGDSGTLIHIAWLSNDDDTIYYANLDASDGSTVSTPVAVYSDSATTRDSTTDTLSITKGTNGNLYVASGSSAASAVPVVRYSTNGGSSWSTTSDEGLDSGVPDPVMLTPLASGDILLMRWDESADDIQSKEYEDGTDSWGGSWDNIDTAAAENSTYREAWGATVNPSNNNIYLAYVNDASLSTSDVKTATYNGSSWTSNTALETDAGYVGGVSIAYDSLGGDVYVGYARAISTAATSSQAVYRVSDDAMSTWSVIRGAVSAQNDDMQAVNMNAVSADQIGMWVFDEDDDDIWYGGVADLGDASGSISATNLQGFESGDAFDASATDGSPAFSTGTVRSGDYSLEIDTSSATEYLDYTGRYHPSYGYDYTTTNYGFSGSFAFRISATPSVATTIFSTVYNATTRFEITLGTDNKLDITGAAGDTAGTYALSNDTWYVFNVSIDGLYLDTAEVGLYSSDMSTQYEYLYGTGTDFSYFNRARLGVTTATTTTLYYDDLILFADAAQSNFPYLVAPYKIARKDLTGTGSYSAWTGNYTAIDEIPTDTADYISETSVLSYTTSSAESSASAGISGQILGIHQANTMWEAVTCSSSIYSPRIIPAGWDVFEGFGPTLQYTGLTTTVADYAWTGTMLPTLIAGGSSELFTTTSIDTFEWGVGTGSTMTSCTVRNGSEVVQIAYIPPATPDISGSLYSDEGSTKITAAAKTIVLTVNGSTTACGGGACTAETSGGDWSIADVTIGSAGAVITVYVDGETEKAVTVTRAASASANITGLNLYQNTVIARDEGSGSISNANLGQYDGDDDADIQFTSNLNALSVSSGSELHVWAGDTYDPGGTVTTVGDFHIEGTASLDTATSTIGDQILLPTGGSLTISANTNVYGNANTIYATGGSLTQTGGTLNVGDDFAENMYISGGSATFSGGTTNIVDEFDLLGGATLNISNTFNVNGLSSYFEIYGASTANINNGADVNLADRLYLHDDGTTLTLKDGSSVDSYDYWLLYSGSFNFEGGTHHVATDQSGTSLYLNGSTVTGITFNMSGSGTIYTRALQTSNNSRNFVGTCTGGTIEITGASATLGLNVTETGDDMNFYNITIAGTTTSVSSSTAKIVNDLTINSGVTFTTNNATIPVGHDLKINSTGVVVAGSSQISVEGSFTDSGTFTAGTSTVTMTGTGNINGTSDTTFYNLTIGDATAGTITVDGTNDPSASNNLNVDTGDTLTINSGRVVTQQYGTGSLTLNGTINGSGRFDYQDSNLFPTTGVLGSSLTLRFDATTADLTVCARTYPGPVEFYTNKGSPSSVFGYQDPTPVYQNTVDLISNSGQTLTVDFDTFAQTNLEFDDDITIGANTVFEAASETTIFDTLIFYDNGTFNHNNGTIQFQNINSSVAGSSDTTFYNISIASSGNVVEFGGYGSTNDAVVTNSLVMDGGTYISIISGRTFTVDSTASFTFPATANIDGGIFVYKPSAAFPTGGGFLPGATLRFDSSANSQTMSARAYYNVQVYGNNTSNTVTAAAGSYTIGGSLDTEQVGTGTTEFDMDTNDPSITINGDFTMGSNTYVDGGTGTIDLNGDLTKEASATWYRNTSAGVLLLSGSSLQTIDATGSSFESTQALQDLTITNNSGTDPQTDPSVIFLGTVSVYGTYTIATANVKVQYDPTGNSQLVSFNFNSPDANKIYFRSTVAGTQFHLQNYAALNPPVYDVDVKDAANDAASVYIFNATDTSNVDNGNNVGWDFGFISIIGTVYTDDGVTPYNCTTDGGGQLDLGVSVNGGASDTGACTSSNGTFSFPITTPTAANQPVVFYIASTETKKATTITLTQNTTSSVLANIYENRVLVDSESGTAVTNTHFSTGDNGNAGIRYSVSGGNLTVETGIGLYIVPGKNFTPGGTVTTTASAASSGVSGDVTIPATATLAMSTNALSVGGDFSNNGSFTLDVTQVTTFTGTGSGYSIEDGGATLGNIVFNGVGGSWSFSSSVVIARDLTMTNGSLTGTNDITSNGGNVAGNGFITLTGGTFTKGGTGNFGGNGDWQFYNLTFASTTAGTRTSTATGSGSITITNILTTQQSMSGENFYPHIILAGSKNWKVMADGTPFVNNGRFQGQTSTFIYEHTDPNNPMYVAQLDNATTNYYYNLTLFGSGFHRDATLILPSSTTYITGNLYVDSDSNGAAVVDGTTNNPTLSVGGNLSCAAEAGQTINTGTATWTVSGNVDLTSCTFTPSTGHTLVMNGTSKTLTTGIFTNYFYNLTLSGSITLSNETHVITGNAVFSGTITAGLSEVKMTGTSNTINGGGNTLYDFTVDPASTGTISTTSTSFTVSHGLTVAAADTLTIGSGLILTWTGSVFSMQSDSTIDGAGRLTVRTATVLGETGWISSVVLFDASTGLTTTMPDRPGYAYGGDVEIYSSSPILTRTVTLEAGTHYISGDLHVINDDSGALVFAGATNNPDVNIIGDMTWSQFDPIDGSVNTTSGTGTWTVSGNVDTSVCSTELGALSCYTATSGNMLDMAGSGKTLTAIPSKFGSAFYNITASGTISFVGRFTISNQLLISGSLTSSDGFVYIGVRFRNFGTFTHNSGTIYFNGATPVIDGTSDTAFYNLTVAPSGTGTVTVDTDLGTDDPTIAGTLNILGEDTLAIESGRTVTFNSGAHTFTFSGTLSGAGTFIYKSSTAFPATGTANSVVRFDATDNDVSVTGTRSFGGLVEVYNTSNADPGVVTFGTAGSQTITCPQGLTLTRTGTEGVTLDLNTQDPAVGVGNPSTDRLLTINTGTTLSLSNTSDLTLYGSYVNAGTLTHNSSSGAVIFSSPSVNPTIDSTGASSAAFSNVIFQDILEIGIVYTLESALDVDNNLTITAGTLDTKAAENNSITVGGSWANTGTFTANSGTVTFDSTSSGKTIAAGGSSFANIVFNGSSGEWTMLSALDVNGTFDVTDGRLIQAANDNINVFGDFTIDTNGLFTAASGTGQLIFDGDLTFADNSSPQQDLGDLQIGTSPDTTNLSTDLTAKILTINDGDILYTNGYDLDIGIGGITVKTDAGLGGGTLDVDDDVETDGTYMATDGIFDLQSGATLANSAGTNVGSTLEFTLSGSAITDVTNDLITVGTGNPYNLVVDDGGGTYTLTVEVEDPVTVENDITITGGVLDTKSGESNSIDVAGNWTNNDTFTARSGTVSFAGADSTTQVISGNTSFYDFTASTSGNSAGRTLRFTAGSTQTVTGTWTITGFSGKVITLESSTTSAWTINPTAASVTYVDVSYSTNSGTSFCATYSNNGGNNTGWSISAGASCGVAISGQIYTDEGSSLLDCSTSRTVHLRINGAGTDTTECSNTPANGSYSFASTAATATDIVDVYLDNETEEATTVFVSDGTAQTDADLYQNWVIVRDDNGSGITNANLNTGDDTDDDVKYNVSGSNVTIDSGFSLHVWTGDTFAPGGTITTQGGGDIHIASGATLNAAGNAITANGDWLNEGTFTHGNNTTTFNATDTGHTINSGGSNFYNVTFNGSGGAWSPLTSTLTIAHDLIMTAGEFNTATGTANVTVSGNTQCLTTCGTINMTSTNTFNQSSASGTHTFGTNVAVGTDWTFYNLSLTGGLVAGSPTIQFNGTGTGATHVLNKLYVYSGPGTIAITVDNETNDRNINVDGDFEIAGAGAELQASSTADFTVAGDWINDGGLDSPGTLTPGTGTITLDGTSQQTLTGSMTGAGKRFYNLTITNAGGSNPDIIFNDPAETENTFTANTADTQIEFTAGDTYTFNNIDLDGQATGTRVFLRSSSTGTQWDLVSNGTQSVSNTDVRDSNACGGDTIDATDGTNRDSTNNDCWLINTVTFDVSDSTIGFGSGSSSASRYATGDTNGSATEVEAHTLSISSNAENGYSLTVYGPTLTSGANTITAIGGSNTAPNPGTEQFGLRMTASGGSGTVSAPYAAAGFAYDGVSSPDEVASTSGLSAVTVYSVRYLLNIAATTDIGSYATDLTYIVTSNF